jgi:hypothetical protein
MEKVQIPSDIDAAVSALGRIDTLLTASKWERACIVAAFTEEGSAGRPGANRPETADSRESFSEFARRRIAGLRSKDTVARYHAAWQWAIDRGEADPVGPGETARLPRLDWDAVPRPEPTASVTRMPEWNSTEWWSVLDEREQEDPGPADDVSRWVAAVRDAVRTLVEHSATRETLDEDDLAVLRACGAGLRTVIAEVRERRNARAA